METIEILSKMVQDNMISQKVASEIGLEITKFEKEYDIESTEYQSIFDLSKRFIFEESIKGFDYWVDVFDTMINDIHYHYYDLLLKLGGADISDNDNNNRNKKIKNELISMIKSEGICVFKKIQQRDLPIIHHLILKECVN